MTFGELLGNLLGWLGQFVEWTFAWVPRYSIVKWNERGVKYPSGREPFELTNMKRSCPRVVQWFFLRNIIPGCRRVHVFPTCWVIPFCRLRGLHWYCPNLSAIEKHHISRMVLPVPSLPLETKDGVQCEVGMVLTYHIVDVTIYEVDNFNPDDNIAEVAQGELQDIVTGHEWDQLQGKTSEESRLGKKLVKRMGAALEKFGIEVESCRPTCQIKLRAATHHFGVNIAHQESQHPL